MSGKATDAERTTFRQFLEVATISFISKWGCWEVFRSSDVRIQMFLDLLYVIFWRDSNELEIEVTKSGLGICAGISRGRPVCIPAPGIQVTNISHVRDLSSMLTLAVEKPGAANGSIFNAVSDRGTTFDGLVRMCAKAAGKDAKIVHYDPKAVGVDAKKAFPFRNMVCFQEPWIVWENGRPCDVHNRFASSIQGLEIINFISPKSAKNFGQ